MSLSVRESSGVWVWAEHHRGEVNRVSLGLLVKARELCQKLGGGETTAVLAGADSSKLASELIDYGADKVYVADDRSFSLFDTERCASFMTALVDSHHPEIVLWGGINLGRETAARAAARLDTGLIAHCIDLDIEDIDGKHQLVAVVAGWGGNLTLKIICPERRPQMATVKPGIFPPPQAEKRTGEVIPVKAEDKSSRLDVIQVAEEKDETSSLEQADTVIAVGWGMNSMGGFTAAEELAEVLGGMVGGTRPALDAGWISEDKMIGQSGKTASPQLLITLGVSGAAQFATTVTGSGFIISVDKNPNAPIFEMSDIGIVGDLQEVLPLLIEKIREIKKKG
jgi:electron transfer flavoprotein alpha subunit